MRVFICLIITFSLLTVSCTKSSDDDEALDCNRVLEGNITLSQFNFNITYKVEGNGTYDIYSIVYDSLGKRVEVLEPALPWQQSISIPANAGASESYYLETQSQLIDGLIRLKVSGNDQLTSLNEEIICSKSN